MCQHSAWPVHRGAVRWPPLRSYCICNSHGGENAPKPMPCQLRRAPRRSPPRSLSTGSARWRAPDQRGQAPPETAGEHVEAAFVGVALRLAHGCPRCRRGLGVAEDDIVVQRGGEEDLRIYVRLPEFMCCVLRAGQLLHVFLPTMVTHHVLIQLGSDAFPKRQRRSRVVCREHSEHNADLPISGCLQQLRDWSLLFCR